MQPAPTARECKPCSTIPRSLHLSRVLSLGDMLTQARCWLRAQHPSNRRSLSSSLQNGLLRLDIPVPEADVPGVRLGKKVSVEVQALSKTFEGTVARFADKVDDATRTMMTEVDVSNPQLEIVPGMYAYVSFPVMEKKDVLAVPIQAVSREGNKAIAYRVNSENRVEVRPVTVGIETRSQIEVLSGLSEGDRVVVGNTSQLRQDQIVAPKIVE